MSGIVSEWIFGRRGKYGSERSLVTPGERIEIQEHERNLADPSPDTQAMLADLNWAPARFDAVCRSGHDKSDAVIAFPSPFPTLPGFSDTATMTWHAARDQRGKLVRGPAVVLLDILHASNLVSGYIGRTLAHNGIHGFVLDLPHSRKRSPGARDCHSLFLSMRQAIAEARRARDVVSAMPNVDGRIGIQGTSFGGFVASIAAGLDGAFDTACLALCGGNLLRIVNEGRVEAAKMRRRLHEAGVCSPQEMHDFLWQVEPMRVAHRLNSHRTWMFVAKRDQVVPLHCSKDLTHAADMPHDHLFQMNGCHYTSCLTAAWWTSRIVQTLQQAWSFENPTILSEPMERRLASA